jgi:hypothetical protein
MGDGHDEPSVARGTGAIRVRARLQAVQNEKWAVAVGLTGAGGASPVHIDDRPAAVVVQPVFKALSPSKLAPPIPLQHTHVHVRPVFFCTLPQQARTPNASFCLRQDSTTAAPSLSFLAVI